MKNLALLAFILCISCAAGCATQVNKQWSPTGGSRADATVELSYEFYPGTEVPNVDDSQGLAMAISRCQAWGYQGAAPFGGEKRVCSNTVMGLWGMTCGTYLVTKQYQCLGQGTETKGGQKR